MSANVGNWIVENSTTVGTGDVVVSGADVGFTRFRDAIPQGSVWYTILDGDDREAGIGVFDGVSTIARTVVHATLVNGVYNDVNPTPIDLSGASVVSCTFNSTAYRELLDHLTDYDNPHQVAAAQVSYDPAEDPVTEADNVQDAMEDHALSIEERTPAMSGVIDGGRITQANATQVDISAGSGTVYNSYTDPENTSVINVVWNSFDNVTIITGDLSTGVIRFFINSVGNVLQVEGEPSLSLWRDNIFLGSVYFMNGEITGITESPTIVKQTATDTNDVMINEIEIKGSQMEPVTDELQLWTRVGQLFYPGINWYNDRTNPNFITVPPQGSILEPIDLYTMTQTGLIDPTPVQDVPTSYNPTGDTITSLPGSQATIHRVYSLGLDSGERRFVVLLGQNQYINAQDARENLQLDGDQTVFPEECNTIHFLGYVCVEGNAADFNNVNDAWIVNNVGGEASGSVGSTTDHTVLVNRDALNQHPIESIGTIGGDQLVDELFAKVPRTSETGSAEIPAGDESERDPAPLPGYFRFNTDDVAFEGYNGTDWGRIGGGGGVWVGDTPPADKEEFPIWFDSRNGLTYTWYEDGTSSQWVQDVAINEGNTNLTVGIVPVGGIIMYSGLFADIPEGWQLCDGTGVTPDLTDTFIMGTNTEGEIGDTGGSADSIVVGHNHSATFAGSAMANHGHSATSGSDGQHNHTTNQSVGGNDNQMWHQSTATVASGDGAHDYSHPTSLNGSHSHTISVVAASAGTPSGSVTVNSEGSSGVGANIPPYLKLAYIMRIA